MRLFGHRHEWEQVRPIISGGSKMVCAGSVFRANFYLVRCKKCNKHEFIWQIMVRLESYLGLDLKVVECETLTTSCDISRVKEMKTHHGEEGYIYYTALFKCKKCNKHFVDEQKDFMFFKKAKKF